MSTQTLGFAVQPEDHPVLDQLVAYFGDGNRSATCGPPCKVMKSIMIADQLREAQAYGQQRTAELGIDPSDIPARVQIFLKQEFLTARGGERPAPVPAAVIAAGHQRPGDGGGQR